MAGYSASEVPEGLSDTSFGCGNPVMAASLMDGETVLDIGSGAGLDVILAARKVGPGGKVIGLDMTPEMIEKANKNASATGLANVDFRLGDAENMPVEDQSVDVIISNCVINLAPDKGKVFAECYRVLKPGGRLMISDIVAEELPEEVRNSKAAWCSCIAGAMKEYDYLEAMYLAGLRDMQIIAKNTYDAQELQRILSGCCADSDRSEEARRASELCEHMAGKVSSITVYAAKKQRGGC
jgi:ubiquinone/menaquinone biosynthesis C-methylase UbiE